MSLIDTIKSNIIEAIKAKRSIEKNILRIVLSDVQTLGCRSNCELTDEQVQSVIRKTLQRNEETLAFVTEKESDAYKNLLEENSILNKLLPSTMTQEEISSWILETPLHQQVRDSKNPGQAIGMAVKALKDAGMNALGSDVKAVVENIRIHG